MKTLSSISFFLIILLGTTLTGTTAANADTLKASVDRNQLSSNESLNLDVRYSGRQNVGAPDFSALENNFDIISNNQSNQFINNNGQVSSYTEWSLVLIPKKEGKLIIPPFSLNGERSHPIAINVTAPAQSPMGSQLDVFLETEVDSASIYVQQQLMLTYRLYYAKNLHSVENTPLELDNVIKEELPVQHFSRIIDDRNYRIAEVRFLLFPQTSGELVIPSLNWDIKIASNNRSYSLYGLSGRYELKRVKTDEKTINVMPQPAEFPRNAAWVPAQSLNLQDSWSKDPNLFKVGEPITRSITLQAEDLMSSQLPKIIRDTNLDEVKIYAEQPNLNDETLNNGMRSTRVESAAIIVSTNGKVTIPAVKIPWWNVKTDSLEYAELPERVITASGESTHSAIQPPRSLDDATSNNPSNNMGASGASPALVKIWQGIALAGFVLAIVFFSLWRQAKNELAGSTRLNQIQEQKDKLNRNALKAMESACNGQDLAAMRASIIHWAHSYWPNKTVSTLQQLQFLIDDESTRHALSTLDKEIYSSDGNEHFDGKVFIKGLKAWLSKQARKGSDSTVLQEFYQTS